MLKMYVGFYFLNYKVFKFLLKNDLIIIYYYYIILLFIYNFISV